MCWKINFIPVIYEVTRKLVICTYLALTPACTTNVLSHVAYAKPMIISLNKQTVER